VGSKAALLQTQQKQPTIDGHKKLPPEIGMVMN
jgi:hypothetical protein